MKKNILRNKIQDNAVIFYHLSFLPLLCASFLPFLRLFYHSKFFFCVVGFFWLSPVNKTCNET